MPWSTGIVECWNTGFGGMISIFIQMDFIEIKT
jgi:hypothetical protein